MLSSHVCDLVSDGILDLEGFSVLDHTPGSGEAAGLWTHVTLLVSRESIVAKLKGAVRAISFCFHRLGSNRKFAALPPDIKLPWSADALLRVLNHLLPVGDPADRP